MTMRSNNPNVLGSHATIARKNYRFKPKLYFAIVLRNMNVRRFGAFIGVEMKAKSKQAKDCWHASIMASRCSERDAVNRTPIATRSLYAPTKASSLYQLA